jgi:hypothetical protein
VLDVGRDIERIRDYLAGRLSDQESEAFGERLVRDPELVRELERTLKLSEGLRQVAHEPRPVAVPLQPRRPRVWLPALAAAASLGVLAVALWRHPATEHVPQPGAALTQTLTAEVTSAVARQFTFVAMRGSEAPILDLPPAGVVELRAAAPPAGASAAYRMTLLAVRPGVPAETVGSAQVAAVKADGYLHVYADAARLKPGAYVLNVLAGDGATPVEAYPFTLRAGGAPAP